MIKTLVKSGIQAAEGGGWEVKVPHAHDGRFDELAQLVGDREAASAVVNIREIVLRNGIVNEECGNPDVGWVKSVLKRADCGFTPVGQKGKCKIEQATGGAGEPTKKAENRRLHLRLKG